MIWKQAFTLDDLNKQSRDTLVQHLAIKYSEKTDSTLSATMPVTSFTHQPFGMLHGGASVVLAETLGSVCGNMCVEPGYYCVGLDISANHIRGKKEGIVTGTATAVHIGRTTQVWQVDIKDEEQHLICSSKLTLMVIKRD